EQIREISRGFVDVGHDDIPPTGTWGGGVRSQASGRRREACSASSGESPPSADPSSVAGAEEIELDEERKGEDAERAPGGVAREGFEADLGADAELGHEPARVVLEDHR